MALVFPIIRLAIILSNVYSSYKTLKLPPPSQRSNSGAPSTRAMQTRKREMKACLSVWIVWACWSICERICDNTIAIFIPFYDNIKAVFLLLFFFTRSLVAEPILLHLLRPIIRPYIKTIDSTLSLFEVLGNFALHLLMLPWLWVYGYFFSTPDNNVVEGEQEPTVPEDVPVAPAVPAAGPALAPRPRPRPRPPMTRPSGSGSNSQPSFNELEKATRAQVVVGRAQEVYQDISDAQDRVREHVRNTDQPVASGSRQPEITVVPPPIGSVGTRTRRRALGAPTVDDLEDYSSRPPPVAPRTYQPSYPPPASRTSGSSRRLPQSWGAPGSEQGQTSSSRQKPKGYGAGKEFTDVLRYKHTRVQDPPTSMIPKNAPSYPPPQIQPEVGTPSANDFIRPSTPTSTQSVSTEDVSQSTPVSMYPRVPTTPAFPGAFLLSPQTKTQDVSMESATVEEEPTSSTEVSTLPTTPASAPAQPQKRKTALDRRAQLLQAAADALAEPLPVNKGKAKVRRVDGVGMEGVDISNQPASKRGPAAGRATTIGASRGRAGGRTHATRALRRPASSSTIFTSLGTQRSKGSLTTNSARSTDAESSSSGVPRKRSHDDELESDSDLPEGVISEVGDESDHSSLAEVEGEGGSAKKRRRVARESSAFKTPRKRSGGDGVVESDDTGAGSSGIDELKTPYRPRPRITAVLSLPDELATPPTANDNTGQQLVSPPITDKELPGVQYPSLRRPNRTESIPPIIETRAPRRAAVDVRVGPSRGAAPARGRGMAERGRVVLRGRRAPSTKG